MDTQMRRRNPKESLSLQTHSSNDSSKTSNMEESPLKPPGSWNSRLFRYLWYDVIYLLYIGIYGVFREIWTSPPKPVIDKTEKRTGQVAVLTGGPRGLALGLIKRLIQLDYSIIIGVRNIQDGEKRLAEFAESNPNLSIDKIKMFAMDLNSLNSVRKFSEIVLAQTSRIDVLLCNAAIMRAPYQITQDGYESQFQVNYLANFFLTQLLLDRMKETTALKNAPCQIIYTSSIVYQFGKFRPNELEQPLVYTPYRFYYPSKLYPVMSMLYLQRMLDNEGVPVKCYAVHPGLVPTDLWYDGAGKFLGMVAHSAKRIFRTLENAADTILWPILSPDYSNRGGLYMESGASIPICKTAKDRDAQKLLYAKSMKLIGLNDNAIVFENVGASSASEDQITIHL